MPKCGAKLEIICPICNFPNPLQFNFCGLCGRNILEKQIIKKIEPPVDSERKKVTVLFSDLSGYTSMAEKLDPEEVKEIISQLFREIARVVVRYDGFIEKFIGDAVMAIFGVPKTHEDDPVRAIQVAIKIKDLVESMSSQLEPRLGKPLSTHIGINTGLVVTGEVNLEKGTHGLVGDTINLASRLAGFAKPGEIIVGPDTYRIAHRSFNFQNLGAIRVKGRTELVAVYKVVSLRTGPMLTNVFTPRDISSPLIGRDKEFAAFNTCLESLLTNRGGVVFVLGESGLGKSRLVAEARSLVFGRELIWLEGSAISFGQMLSYWPFLEIIKNYADITDKDDESTSWSKLASKVTDLSPEQAAEILPYIASLPRKGGGDLRNLQ